MENSVLRKIKHIFNLREGALSSEEIIENVKDDSDITSAQFWTLVCAVGLASVGLNINSVPVVIGAMLISPLMGPIVSFGLALSIFDRELMRRSVRNLLILVAISVSISFLYFLLTPITNAQSELLARTQPTIFDLMIAIFGGVAGFIGLSRSRATNVVPGVAIATALMPPLCTVGYGLATWQASFIFGAFYLFLINSIFICLSALLVAKYLKLPSKKYLDEDAQKRVRRMIGAVILIITLPSIYLAYTFVSQNNFKQNAERYIEQVFTSRDYVVVYQELSYSTKGSSIELAFLGNNFTGEQLTEFNDRLKDYGLKNTKLNIIQQGFSINEQDWLKVLEAMQSDEEKIKTLESLREQERLNSISSVQLAKELTSINNEVSNFTLSKVVGEEEEVFLGYVEFRVASDTATSTNQMNDLVSIESWLKSRLGTDLVRVIK
jgi:uncharacterized hydrophobic protein (TIGR00271 family)